jgi:hypothetical protein
MRACLLLAALGCVAGLACDQKPLPFIEAHGALSDGTPFDLHAGAAVDAGGSPWKLEARTHDASGLSGFALWFDPAVKSGTPYMSGPNAGDVEFFVLRPIPDAFADTVYALVNGGAVTFSTAGPDRYEGVFGSMVLIRQGQTLVTVDRGSFLALR